MPSCVLSYRSSIHRRGVWLVLVFLSVTAVYATTLGHGFVFDDTIDVVDNPLVQSWDNLGTIFSAPSRSGVGLDTGLYRPITSVSYLIDHSISGLDPAVFHATNILLHAAVSVLVMFLAMSLGAPVAASGIAAILFGVHPAHVEVVANIAGRKEALMAGLLLAGLLARHVGLRKGGAWQLAAATLYLLAILSKETAIVGLPVILLWDRLLRGAENPDGARRRRHSYWLWAGAVLLYAVMRWNAVGGLAPPEIPFLDNPAAHAGLGSRVMTAFTVLALGVWHIVAPIDLSPDYSFNAIPIVSSLWDGRFLIAIGTIATMVALVLRWHRKSPVLVLALMWYLLAILPASNLILPIGTIFGDRMLYLPSTAVFALAAVAMASVPHKVRYPAVVVGLAILGGLVVQTVTYSKVWRDEISLFEYAVGVVPGSAKVRYNLGTAYAEVGRMADAEREFTEAIETYPEFSQPHNQLGNLYLLSGRAEQAKVAYSRAVQHEDRNAEAHYNLALLLDADGDIESARRHFRRFLALASGTFPEQADYARSRLSRLEADLQE